MAEGNGVYKMQLDKIESDVSEIKDDLAHAIEGLTAAVTGLSSKFDAWVRVAENVVPIRFVLWILAGVLILVVLLFAGVEGIRALLKIPTV